MWREFIQGLEPKAVFFTVPTETQLTNLENTFQVALPEELRSLLRESNGVRGNFGLRLIWSTEEISRNNLEMRQSSTFTDSFMPFDSLLFFADAGNGDKFAFPIVKGVIKRSDIFVWDHENDSRSWVAPSLKHYLEWWLSGKLNI